MNAKFRRNPVLLAILDELKRSGITDYDIEVGSKHPRVVFLVNGRKQYAVFSGSCSDPTFAPRKAVGFLRRQIAEGAALGMPTN